MKKIPRGHIADRRDVAPETTAGFMLHSGRSFPGTPDWPGSRTGTGPGRAEGSDGLGVMARLAARVLVMVMTMVKEGSLTSVWTVAGLWVRSILTVWKMSTTPSYLIRSSTMLRVMNTPVRPTPALTRAQVWNTYD